MLFHRHSFYSHVRSKTKRTSELARNSLTLHKVQQGGKSAALLLLIDYAHIGSVSISAIANGMVSNAIWYTECTVSKTAFCGDSERILITGDVLISPPA